MEKICIKNLGIEPEIYSVAILSLTHFLDFKYDCKLEVT